MKRLIAAPCAVATMILAVAGCSGSDAPPRPTDAAVTYLANNKSEIAFLQWRTTTGDQVTGTLTADTIGGAAPAASLSVNSVPFTGTVHRNSVDLAFAHGLFLQSHASGRLSGGTMTLAIPYADGVVRATTFTQSSRSKYDHAVAGLNRSAQQQNLLAAQAGSHPSANSRAVQRNTHMDLAALYQASSLAPQAKLTNDVNHFASDTATARSRLAKEKQDTSLDNHYCAATSTVVGDSQGVHGSALAVHGDIESLNADITAIRMDIRTVNADLHRESKAGLSGPTSAPELIATAKSSMAQAIASANSYIGQVNVINNQASALANHMATGKCSGPGQTAPSPPIEQIK
jgi:hypothetical protein